MLTVRQFVVLGNENDCHDVQEKLGRLLSVRVPSVLSDWLQVMPGSLDRFWAVACVAMIPELVTDPLDSSNTGQNSQIKLKS